MTLLYMYFSNASNETYKGIKPNNNGYRFDNRFDIYFNNETKTFEINDNPNYVQVYNNAISNISCVVGRNGSGKTTFIELLLANIVWGMTPYQPSNMVSVYYNINSKGDVEFFLHHFKNSLKNNGFKLLYNAKKKQFSTNHHSSYSRYRGESIYTSTIPINTKFIFHSLSPFDKIFYSIGQTLKDSKYTTSHYIKQMNYIGTQSFFKDEIAHEIQTISNLISLFTRDFGKQAFEDSLGYTFSELKIDFNKVEAISIDDIEVYIENIENALDGYTNIIMA